jgi:cation diffusion facilitator family transporter
VRNSKQNLKIQYILTALTVIVFALKMIVFLMTHALSVLSDTLESVVNIIATIVGSYSMYIAAKPKDKDHPYGHGKAEFVSSAFQGSLIIGVGCLIIYESVQSYYNPGTLHNLGNGFWILILIALINIGTALYVMRMGKKNNTTSLITSGKLFLIDFFTTFSVALGLLILMFTGIQKVDAIIAILLGAWVLYDGYKILRASLAGIMDEADMALLENVIAEINDNRNDHWVDLHNLRVIKYGPLLHIDCHLTMPWYLNVHEAHTMMDQFTDLVKSKFGDSVEFFIHIDGCMPFSCDICSIRQCEKRQAPFQKRLNWTMENVLANTKHQLIN